MRVVWPRPAPCEGPSPPPRQQGSDPAARPVSSRWGGARLLKRVLAIDLERCPWCPPGAWRSIVAFTWRPVLCHILASPPIASQARGGSPPLALVRLEPGQCAWASVWPPRDDGGSEPLIRAKCVRSVGLRGSDRASWRSEAAARGGGGLLGAHSRGMAALNPVDQTWAACEKGLRISYPSF
jgi:hypothetical protein